MLLLESLPTVIGTAAVAPALLFLWLVIATDERPGPPLRVWSAFFLGAEEIARTTRYAAFFVRLKRIDRGHYQVEFVRLAEAGEQLPSGEFTARYARLVEEQIRAAPADWPWSHKRWKLKKPLYCPT